MAGDGRVGLVQAGVVAGHDGPLAVDAQGPHVVGVDKGDVGLDRCAGSGGRIALERLLELELVVGRDRATSGRAASSGNQGLGPPRTRILLAM